ncbi:MAG: hypothetical protein WKG07_13685 [Hymenobacter sp.]
MTRKDRVVFVPIEEIVRANLPQAVPQRRNCVGRPVPHHAQRRLHAGRIR